MLQETLPPLEKIIHEIEELAESGGKYAEAPHVIEVTLPMLCRYDTTAFCKKKEYIHVFDLISKFFFSY